MKNEQRRSIINSKQQNWAECDIIPRMMWDYYYYYFFSALGSKIIIIIIIAVDQSL